MPPVFTLISIVKRPNLQIERAFCLDLSRGCVWRPQNRKDPIVTTQVDVWKDVHAERKALLELLQNLSASQWDTPSLCSEWRVRDVVGHMVSETTLTILKVLVGTIASGFRIDLSLPLTHAVAETLASHHFSTISGQLPRRARTSVDFRLCRCSMTSLFIHWKFAAR